MATQRSRDPNHSGLFDNVNPANLGTAGPGVSQVAARRDHIHSSGTVSFTDAIEVVIGDSVNTITTGVKLDLEIPFACTINRVTLLADASGSIVIDIWKDVYANFPPTVADTITASAKPTLTSAQKSQDSTLTGWTTAIVAGDTLRFNVDSVSTVKRVVLSLKVTRS